MDWLLIFCGATGAFATAQWGYRALLSREVIAFDRDEISLRRGAMVLTFPEKFRLTHSRRLRAAPEAEIRSDFEGGDPWGFAAGRNVAFDYGPRTVRFGLRLGEAEAQQVVEAIKRLVNIPDALYVFPDPAISSGETKEPEAPPAPRARVSDDGWNLRITIPASRDRLFTAICGGLVFFAIWLAMLSVLALDWRGKGLSHASNIVPLIFMTFTLVGLARRAMWNLFGREEILMASNGTLQIVRNCELLKYRHSFDLRHVSAFKVSIMPGPPAGLSGTADAALERRNIRFICADNIRKASFRFGMGLEEAEANTLAHLLQERAQAIQSGAVGF
jgi:hypothetical protein